MANGMGFARGGVITPAGPNQIEAALLSALTARVPSAWRLEWRHESVWVFPDIGDSYRLNYALRVAGHEDEAAARFVAMLIEKVGCCDQGRLLVPPLPCPWHPPDGVT